MNIIWKNTPKEMIDKGFGSKTFIKYSLKHKLRLIIGVCGSMYKGDKEYFFYGDPKSSKTIRKICKILTPLLNKIL